jgi:hypothetical protein
MMFDRRGFLALSGAFLSACAPTMFNRSDFQLSRAAWQRPWPKGMPLRDNFFPIGLYNVLADGEAGQTARMADIKEAGFNSIVAWGAQNIETLFEQTEQQQLMVIWPNPTFNEARSLVQNSRLLALELDHEPTLRAQQTPLERDSLAAFVKYYRDLRAMGHDAPLMTFNSPAITPPFTDHWRGFAEASDVIGFWKYSYRDGIRSLSGPRGLPEAIQFARTIGDKPIWPVLQAMRSPILNWQWPTEAQMAAQAMAALIHGATALFWFSLDNAVSRAGQVIGASPKPQKSYARRDEPLPLDANPLEASDDDLRRSKETWDIIRSINQSVSVLSKYFALPDAEFGPDVFIRGTSHSETPIRLAVKPMPHYGADHFLLALVNLDDAALDIRLEWPDPLAEACVLFRHQVCADLMVNGRKMEFTLAPYGVQTWLIRRA